MTNAAPRETAEGKSSHPPSTRAGFSKPFFLGSAGCVRDFLARTPSPQDYGNIAHRRAPRIKIRKTFSGKTIPVGKKIRRDGWSSKTNSKFQVRHFFALEALITRDGSARAGEKLSFAAAEADALRPRFPPSTGTFFSDPLTEKKIPRIGVGGGKGDFCARKIIRTIWARRRGTLCRGIICACLGARLRFCGAKTGFFEIEPQNFLPPSKSGSRRKIQAHQRRSACGD